MEKLNIAFVCVHNSCRSQMAEAITKSLANDVFNAYSAGTETKPQINQDAVLVINDLYQIDMNQTQKSKLLDDLPNHIDILVTMGCNVECPFIPTKHREDWGLDDPTGQPIELFYQTADLIKEKLMNLKNRVLKGEILK